MHSVPAIGMRTAPLSDSNVTVIDWSGDPGPEAFERFYRQITDRDELPSIPEVARHLMMAVNRPNTTGRQLADLIQRDPALATKLLSLVNSAFFGLRRPVTDLGQAVMLLGFGSVRDLVMTISLWGSLGDSEPTTKRRRKSLWIHCASVGATAKLLSKQVGRIDAGAAMSAGLLHDLGKLLLGLRLGSTYWDMLDQARESGEDPTAVEVEALGIHHGRVGQYMLQLWGLPQTIFEAVSDHHMPLEPGIEIGVPQVVNISNRLVDLMDRPGARPEREGDESATEGPDEVAELLEILAPGRINPDLWVQLQEEIADEQKQIAGFFAD